MKEMIKSDTHIPISAIGDMQHIDISRSSGIKWATKYFRACTVLKGPKHYSSNGDRSPHRLANLVNGHYLDYNDHIIFQVPTCPYSCPYCYVDRLENDIMMTPKEIVEEFHKTRTICKNLFKKEINVLHMMGGDPAVYAKFWPELRKKLDEQGLKEVILYSDCLMIEDDTYGIKPWTYINIDRFLLVCNLKGSSWFKMHRSNGGHDTFRETLKEAMNYVNKPNVYFTIMEHDLYDLIRIYDTFDKNDVDLLNIVHYEVTKKRLEGNLI